MRWWIRRRSRRCTAASCAGVKIDLIVRGVCALRPGVPGVSENIRVRSIVGRFLEHSRVFYFENGGEPEMYCASADWMERNFFRRVEVAFPAAARGPSRAHPARPGLCLSDNCQAWLLQPDGSYRRVVRPAERAAGERRRTNYSHCTRPDRYRRSATLTHL